MMTNIYEIVIKFVDFVMFVYKRDGYDLVSRVTFRDSIMIKLTKENL